ncbi:MAG TPA: glycosyltransferase family 2 protein [Candidatus Limnocylindrales bacterium]|nr:glycosyltransferase family 2 protein [Candidatus Limnocylindrales bacterium]
MMLSIISINYKKSHLTINCIDSLYKLYNDDFEKNKFELIIVENGSEDDSLDFINIKIAKDSIKNIKVINNKKNEGFAKGCNIGAKEAKGKYLLFLNNDTTVMDKGIVRMVEYMDKNIDVSILGGQLTNVNGEKQSSAGKFYTLFNTFLLLLGMQKFGLIDKSFNKVTEVDWVKGAMFMMRKDVFDKLSGFDEKIFMYIEDMELCYRAKKAGFRTFFYPDVSVIHQDQGSSSRSFAVANIYKGLLYFYKKHRSNMEYILVKAMLYVKAYVAITIGYITRNKYLTTTFRQAIQF